jgi:hypothetical protein
VAPALMACGTHPLDVITTTPTTLTDGLLAHYTFDEGSGTIVVDHSGNRHDGVLTGGTWIASGKFGGALHMGGSDSVTIDSFPDAPSSFSVSAWVRTVNAPIDGFETVLSTEIVFRSGWQLNLDKTDAGTGAQFAYWDKLRGDGGGYVHPECFCVRPNVWTHIVAALDGGERTLKVYVNATLMGTEAAPRAILPGTPALLIGKWSGDTQRFFVGDIDDVAIYKRALTPAEVSELEQHFPPDP